jgi:hypothetical protein
MWDFIACVAVLFGGFIVLTVVFDDGKYSEPANPLNLNIRTSLAGYT